MEHNQRQAPKQVEKVSLFFCLRSAVSSRNARGDKVEISTLCRVCVCVYQTCSDSQTIGSVPFWATCEPLCKGSSRCLSCCEACLACSFQPTVANKEKGVRVHRHCNRANTANVLLFARLPSMASFQHTTIRVLVVYIFSLWKILWSHFSVLLLVILLAILFVESLQALLLFRTYSVQFPESQGFFALDFGIPT